MHVLTLINFYFFTNKSVTTLTIKHSYFICLSSIKFNKRAFQNVYNKKQHFHSTIMSSNYVESYDSPFGNNQLLFESRTKKKTLIYLT
jgi:hypothetical protein